MSTEGQKQYRLLTVRQTAERLGVSEKMIRNALCRGSKTQFPLKPVRIGGAVRFREKDVAEITG